MWSFQGAKFRDPHDITSDMEFIEGATIVVVYELPTQAKPAVLKLCYSYLESWEDEDVKYGQIDIKINK